MKLIMVSLNLWDTVTLTIASPVQSARQQIFGALRTSDQDIIVEQVNSQTNDKSDFRKLRLIKE